MRGRISIALAAAALLFSTGAAPRPDTLNAEVRAWRMANEKAIVGQLDELVRLPSVAADPKGLQATADTLEGLLRARGFATRQFTDGGAPPLVFGELKTPGAKRTVVFYGHYDGQPVIPSQWKTPPFEPTMRAGGLDAPVVDWRAASGAMDPEWRFFGRATCDDKVAMVAFLAAFDALKAKGRKLGVNIKVVWEGEEEAGSPHLMQILSAHKEAFAGDLWLIGDGPVHQSRNPSLYFGARGVMSLEATVYGPARPLHDGHYGNWAPNPAVLATELVGQLRDGEGRILIPGFAQDVAPVTDADRAAIASMPPVDASLRKELALGRTEGTDSLALSLMRPALNIRGIRAGGVGAQATNAIQTEAQVSIDFRLVPDQTPAGVRAQTEAYLASKGWTVVHEAPDAAMRMAHPRIVFLDWGDGYPALRTPVGDALSQTVIAASSRAFDQPVTVIPLMGGSVPIYMFKDVFGQPIIGLPLANHDNNQHAANENLRLQNLWDGIQLYARLMSDLNW